MRNTRPTTRPGTARVGGDLYGGTLPERSHKGAALVRKAPLGAPAGRQEQERDTKGGRQMVVLRREIGDVLRNARQRQGRTLREVSSAARVSLGYLSEVERGQKEASSELLASICYALDTPLSIVLREVSDRIAVAEGLLIPDTVPADLASALARQDRAWARQRAELAPIG